MVEKLVPMGMLTTIKVCLFRNGRALAYCLSSRKYRNGTHVERKHGFFFTLSGKRKAFVESDHVLNPEAAGSDNVIRISVDADLILSTSLSPPQQNRTYSRQSCLALRLK